MKRRALSLSLIFLTLFAAGVPTAFGQSCATPPPTYTPTPGYRATVQAVSPGNLVVYLPLNETSGTIARDDSGNGANGDYGGVTLNAATFLTGEAAGSWDGINDYVSFWTQYLQDHWNAAEGGVMLWAKVPASVWTDNTLRFFINFVADVNNLWRMRKLTSNLMQWTFLANAINRQVMATISPTSWTQYVLTWSQANNHIVAYRDGVLVATVSAPGVWANPTLNPTQVAIGAASSSGTNPMVGNIAQVAVWNVEPNATQVAYLATIDPTQIIPPTATLCPSWTPTFTPSHTPTFTPTPSNTPNIRTYLTVIPPGSSAPGQDVLILHQVTAGQGIQAALLFVVVVILTLSFIRQLRGRS